MVPSVWRADFVMGPIRSKLSVGNTRGSEQVTALRELFTLLREKN